MKFERFSVKACCGTSSIAYKLSSPIGKDLLAKLVAAGFTENKHFTASNILYSESVGLIIKGTFGSDNLQLKCKTRECDIHISSFEEILATLE